MHPRKYTYIYTTGTIRSEKRRRKQYAMLTSQQNVPRIVFIQISVAIIVIVFTISQPVLQITNKIRCIDPFYEGQRP